VHLKSLVLKGFKSFADRSVLGFEPGITAVVGPNGSGKSNISDAVLWVLGERNAKSLRGQTMEDVIFAGSSARKSVGIAEVDLILDNSDHTLPIDFDEVALTRRMYRSGESEYLINGALARRMDVLDILHDTGLGTGTNSIISQGNLDTILQSKPEDRRSLIEEAAGVLKHKQRKMKSERKLEQMDNHLMRVRDVAAEVERQLKPLERKAKRAQSYQGLAAELADLNLVLAVDDLRMLQSKWGKVSEQESKLVDELEGVRLLIKQTEDTMQSLQEQMQEQSSQAGDLARQHRRAQSALERFDAAILLLHEKRRSTQAYGADTRIALETNTHKLAQATRARTQAQEQLQDTTAQLSIAEEQANRLESEQVACLSHRASLEKNLEDFLRSERELSQEMETIRAARAANQEALSTSKAQEQLFADQSLALGTRLAALSANREKDATKLQEQKDALASLEKRATQVRDAVAQSTAQREDAQKIQESLREELAVAAAQIKGLEELERSSASANQALAWLMEHKSDFASEIEVLSDHITAPKELEALVENFLGADLDALCLRDIQTANAIAETLCARNLFGDIVLFANAKDTLPARKAPAFGTSLLSLLQYPSAYATTLESLLGDIYLCDSIAEALKAHAQSGSNFRFATREGFMVWPDNKITLSLVGTGDATGSLARRRQLDTLKAERARLKAALSQAHDEKETTEANLHKAQSESLRLSQECAEMQGLLKAAQSEFSRLEESVATLHREEKDLSSKREAAKKVLGSAEPALGEQESRLVELASSLDEMKVRSISAQKDIIPLREEASARDEELASARLTVATLTERENYARRLLATKEQEIRSLNIEIQVARETLAKKLIAQERVEPLQARFESLADSVRAWIEQLESASAQEQDLSSGLHSSITQARSGARSAHDSFDEVNERLSQSRVEKGRLEIQVETAINTIVHDCKTPLETAIEKPALTDRAEIEDKAFKLRRRIANMGTINPDAAVEYEELKKRFDYMATQLDDMYAARRALAKIIRVIDTRMKDDFVVTFEKVNENFKEIFSTLFPGGAAELKLVDPDDLENTGIEVTAQPKGKRITKMMLMSGGEKSLTALALLFAVYRIRSTPFYILDEVEAALDDTNLRRICAYFDSLRQTTQLILITHQRRTMEVADVLYGVTMQSDGVTKVVSQRLDRALQYAEDK